MWLEHPSYSPARDHLVKYLRSDNYRFRRLKPVLFLCGGSGSRRRDNLRDYLHKHAPEVSVFYAERVWEHIAATRHSSRRQTRRVTGITLGSDGKPAVGRSLKRRIRSTSQCKPLWQG